MHTNDLIISQPTTAKGVKYFRSSSPNIDVVSDSVAAPPRGSEGEWVHNMGLRRNVAGASKLTAIAAKSNTIVIFINQTRMKIGLVFDRDDAGWNGIKFYASVRIDIRHRTN